MKELLRISIPLETWAARTAAFWHRVERVFPAYCVEKLDITACLSLREASTQRQIAIGDGAQRPVVSMHRDITAAGWTPALN